MNKNYNSFLQETFSKRGFKFSIGGYLISYVFYRSVTVWCRKCFELQNWAMKDLLIFVKNTLQNFIQGVCLKYDIIWLLSLIIKRWQIFELYGQPYVAVCMDYFDCSLEGCYFSMVVRTVSILVSVYHITIISTEQDNYICLKIEGTQ